MKKKKTYIIYTIYIKYVTSNSKRASTHGVRPETTSIEYYNLIIVGKRTCLASLNRQATMLLFWMANWNILLKLNVKILRFYENTHDLRQYIYACLNAGMQTNIQCTVTNSVDFGMGWTSLVAFVVGCPTIKRRCSARSVCQFIFLIQTVRITNQF